MAIAVKSVFVLAAALAVAWILRKKPAAHKHAVWSAAFVALLVLPLFSITLPRWRVSVPARFASSSVLFEANVSGAVDDGRTVRVKDRQPLRRSAEPIDWRLGLLLLWGAGVMLSLGQVLAGWIAIARRKRSANPIASAEFSESAKLLELNEQVSFFETAPGSMPITYGMLQPTIFLPSDMAEWKAEQRRMVLLHELAHVKRGDVRTHLLARIALSFYWWNPLAWIAWREFLKEREKAADDLVLSAGASATDYASHLLEVARTLDSPRVVAYTGIAMARRSQLEGRLLAILDSDRNRTVRRVSPLLSSLLAICLAMPISAFRAQSNPGSSVSAAPASSSSFEGLIQEADSARDAHDFDKAAGLYKRAVAIAANAQQRATGLIHLGIAELGARNEADAIHDFDQAQNADSGRTAEAEMWTAIAQERQSNLSAAETSYANAVAAAIPDSAMAATIMELYAQLLRQEDKTDEADSIKNQASAIRKAEEEQLRTSGQVRNPDVYKIGGDVKAPTLAFKVEPAYSEEARVAKYVGTVLLSIEIDSDGSVRDISIVRGLGFGLSQKAVEAVSKWKFNPATKNGEAVAVTANVEVNFRLL